MVLTILLLLASYAGAGTLLTDAGNPVAGNYSVLGNPAGAPAVTCIPDFAGIQLLIVALLLPLRCC
jgi:hypothetical protein